jgi:predicted phosphodiesterase
MRTVVVSDLHLGARSRGDLLRRGRFIDLLAREFDGADQVILLGDALELRDGPVADVVEVARPFFEALGEAIGDGIVVVVPGNHDHQLLAPWLEDRRMRDAGPLELEQRLEPTGTVLGSLARRMGKAEVVVGYPGVWIGPGVYATHGHYLDCHLTVPTFERLGVGAMERLVGGLPHGGRAPDDYEAVQAPLYSFLYGLAQGRERTRRLAGAQASARAWRAMYGRDGRPRSRRGWMLGAIGVPVAVRLANRLGIGPLNADLSIQEIGRAGVRAMREVATRLGIDADHLIFGHTHRRGPRGAEPGWSQSGGPRLHNTGSWVYAPALLGRGAGQSPFWPGTVGIVEDDRVPELVHLLDDVPHDELRGRR